MIKMFINDEEVVSNKELVIKEEMLATPSAILNNCYPKTWEDIKDYTSNFYYPKDYSRCIIGQGSFKYGTNRYAKLNISGVFPTFETNTEKPFDEIQIDGKSTQATRSGKNLFNATMTPTIFNSAKYTTFESSFDDNSIKFIFTQDVNALYLYNFYVVKDLTNFVGKKVRASVNISSTGNSNLRFAIGLSSSNGSNRTQLSSISESGTVEFTVPKLTSGKEYLAIWVYADNGGTSIVGDEVIYSNIMLTLDNEDLSFEPYGVMPSPDYPSEIESVGTYNEETGKYQIEVKNTGKNLFSSSLFDKTGTYALYELKDNTPYTLSLKLKEGKSIPSGLYVGFSSSQYSSSNPPTRFDIIANGVFSNKVLNKNGTYYQTIIDNSKFKYAFIYPKNINIEEYFDVMLTESSSLLDYEPYKSVSSLFTLNQPLRSLPNGVKDIAYIKNGILYVDRKVGSVVLDGSDDENWTINGRNQGYGIVINDVGGNSNSSIISGGYCNCLSETIQNNIYSGRKDNVFATLGGTLHKIYVRYNSSITSIALLKEQLNSQPIIVQYELAEPYTEKIGEVDNLSTFKGVNNVSLDANMETNMNLTYLWENYKLLFCGIVKNSGNISLNPRYPHFGSFQILDFKTFLSESDTLDFVISNKTITEAIEMVIDAISTYGFILGNINIFGADDVIGAYSTQNKTAYDVFQYIAEITGSRWFTRLIDEKTIAIDFYDPTLMERGNNLEYNEKYFEDNYVVDLSFSYGSRDYRNKQVILSDEIYASIDYTEVILSNGYQTTFNTENNIGIIKSIYIDNTEKTFATNNEKETGIDAEFYYTPGKSSFESDGSTYPAGTQITITYTPLVRGRQVVYNNDEVARIYAQTGRKGVIARYESRNDILSSKELDKVGQSYIKYKGSPEVILTLTTEEKDLYNIGQIVYFDSPIPELAQDYMIKSKQIKIIMIDEISQKVFFIYELTSSFNAEKEINYFDNQRNKNKGNISVGETITRNIDIENTANIIFKDMTINEASATGNNLLNSVLNSPFVE